VPSPETVTRLLGLAGAKPLAGAVNAYLAAGILRETPAYPVSAPVLQPQVACDGKMARGALRGDGTPLLILSAAAVGERNAPHGAVVIADAEIPAKTNEIPEMAPMLRELNDRLPLAGMVLTADALHTQDGFAELATGELGAQFVLTVKNNRKNLRKALEALCWAGAARCQTEDKGHGRRETRSLLLMDAPGEIKALYPRAEQIAKVHRVRTVRYWLGDGSTWRLVTKTTRETVYLVTSLSAREAGPEHITAYIREHWRIENCSADCTYG
jgi:predicted transposase YbfD/YdcC